MKLITVYSTWISFLICGVLNAQVTIEDCGASWMNLGTLQKALNIELANVPPADRAHIHIRILACTENKVAINAQYQSGGELRLIPLTDVAGTDRIRAVALVICEMIQELMYGAYKPQNKTDDSTSSETPTTEKRPPPSENNAPPQTSQQVTVMPTKRTAMVTVSPPRNGALKWSLRGHRTLRFQLEAGLLWFMSQQTLAPELRLMFRIKRLNLGYQISARRWQTNLGQVYIWANSATVGVDIINRPGRITRGIDINGEAGIVMGKGSAAMGYFDNGDINLLMGAHAVFWARLGVQSGLLATMSAGGIRGMVLYADQRHIGGLHGPVLRLSIGWIW